MMDSSIEIIQKLEMEYKQRKTTSNLPFVTLTYAQSLDGAISGIRGQPLSISSNESMKLTHKMRSFHDAILVGVNTVIADNPSLTVRLVSGRNPIPVILDSSLRCPLDCKLLNSIIPYSIQPIILVVEEKCDTIKRQAIESCGARVVGCKGKVDDESGNIKVDLGDALDRLGTMGIHSLMVEGGATVITEFLSRHISIPTIDYLNGGVHCLNRYLGEHSALRLKDVTTVKLEGDIVVSGTFNESSKSMGQLNSEEQHDG